MDVDENLLKFAKLSNSAKDQPAKENTTKKSAKGGKSIPDVVSHMKKACFADIPYDWLELLDVPEVDQILAALYGQSHTPGKDNIFRFARVTPLEKIKVVIVGQDPYPRAGDADGLAFSCLTGIPPSLTNVFKCLYASKQIKHMPTDGNLEYWAAQGVLLLNRSLTTTVGKSNTHVDLWYDYTTELVKKISELRPMIFMLWGNNAKELSEHINPSCTIYEWTHPSPLAQSRQSFIKCPHFIDANKLLKRLGHTPIDWNLEPARSEIEIEFGADSTTQVVFTDGSCFPNQLCPAAIGGYAASFALGTLADTVLYGNIQNRPHFASNQRAEGIAMLRVMEYLKEHIGEWEKCIIVSDSEFWIKMFESYMPSWAANDKFDEKKNPDLTKKMWALYSELTEELNKTIQFRHMKSHGKDGWQNESEGSYKHFCFVNNNYVDELASYARQHVAVGEDIIEKAKYEG